MSAAAGPVFMGTSPFAVTVLERLAGSSHRPSLVVTPPDRRKGRGRRLSPPPAAIAARELGLELHQADSVNAEPSLHRIRESGAAVAVVCAFGQLIGDRLIDELEPLNIHPSLLPRWRGAAPIERAIMAGDRTTGVCIMRLVAELDAGPVALRAEEPILGDDDFGTLSERLAEVAGELLVEALDRRAAGTLEFEPQAGEGLTYAEKITASDRTIDVSETAVACERRVRALSPHIGARLRLADDRVLGVGAAEAIEAALEPGAIATDERRLLVGCSEGALAIERLQPPGKTMMAAADWLRGHEPPSRVAPPALQS